MWVFKTQLNIALSLIIVVSLFGFVFQAFTVTYAAPNYQINYQGKLTNASNVAVPDGTYNMRFWLLTTPSIATTSAVWTESLTGTNKVTVTNGLFSIMLGSTSPLTGVNFNQTLYLGVEIGGTSTPAWDGEMSPRKVLGAVPAAFEADKLDGLNSTQFVRTDATSTIASSSPDTLLTVTQNGAGDILNLFGGTTKVFSVLSNGNVGVGTSSPLARFSVAGNSYFGGNVTATGTLGVSGLSTFTSGFVSQASSTISALTVTTGTTTNATSTNLFSSIFTATNGTIATLLGTNATIANATTTNLAATSFKIGADVITDITGTGLSITNGVLNASATGGSNWLFDGTRLTPSTTVGIGVFASSTIGGGTGATGLTVSGNSTTTGAAYFAGKVSLGSTTPEGHLTIDRSSLTGGIVAGIKEYLNFTNSTLGAVYYGDNAYIVNAPTATSTLVGNIIRIEDSTALGNTVRGLEVQAHRGTNIRGENTGISAFGRTFGIRGTTEGDAGDTFAPAGVFAESRGTIQGNAIRGYSGTITTSSLAQLYQDMSAFSGTGLLMNFGNGGGSFSGANAKFLDLQNGGVSKMVINSDGWIGIGTTSPWKQLSVVGSMSLSGAFYDTASSSGTNGYVLQTTGTSTRWVATSTLGITGGGGATTFLALTDTPSSYTANRIPFTNSGATALTDSANLVFTGTNFGIGTTTPVGTLSVVGNLALTQPITNALIIGDVSGNARGTNALDIQSYRSVATQVASGTNATAIGQKNTVICNASVNSGCLSVGYGNTLSGAYDGVAVGISNSVTSGTHSSAFGHGNTINATIDRGTAIGYNNTINNHGGTAVGSGNSVYGNASGFGTNNSAIGGYSNAVGFQNLASDSYSSAFGASSTASAQYSSSFGYNNIASGSYSSVFGYNNIVSAQGASAFGSYITNNIASSTQIGPSDSAKLTILGNGNVGIGTTSPSSLLTISNNVATAANTPLFTIASTTGGTATSTLFTVLANGNVGIGSSTPSSKLTVEGDSKFIGNINVNSSGSLAVVLEAGGGSTVSETYNVGGVSKWRTMINQGNTGLYQLQYGSSNTTALTLTPTGTLGIGTTTPSRLLTVAGDIYTINNITAASSTLGFASSTALTLTGRLFDSTNSAGTNGMILQTNGSGTTWVATSTLGIGGGATTFLALTDTPSSYTANRIPFTNSGATALTDSANLTFDGSLLSITGGLRATASSTIGDGTGAGGLTVFGNATTTGDAYFAGNVGIGTQAQSRPMTINQNGDDSGLRTYGFTYPSNYLDLSINNSGNPRINTNASLVLEAVTGAGGIYLRTGTSGVVFNDITPQAVNFNKGQFSITSVGNVGIGTTSPTSALFVQSASSTQSLFTIASSTGSSLLTVLANGNVGVGSSTPSEKFSVVGTSTFQGAPVKIGDGLVAMGSRSGLNSDVMNVGVSNTLSGSGLVVVGRSNSINSGSTVFGMGNNTSSAGSVVAIGLSNQATYDNSVVMGRNNITDSSKSVAIGYYNNVGPWTISDATAVGRYNTASGLLSNAFGGYNVASGNYSTAMGYMSTSSAIGASAFGSYIVNNIASSTMIGPSDSAKLTILGTGNVAIGTTTPSAKLTIWGSDTSAATLSFNIVNSASTTLLSVFNNGYVGIGTTTPSSMLTVGGTVSADSFVAASSTMTNTIAGGLNVGNGGLVYDYSSGVTSIPSLAIGNLSFDTDAGMVSWVDLPISTTTTAGTIESYTANIAGSPLFTVYGEADGSGGLQNGRLGLGTTTPAYFADIWGNLNVATGSTPALFVNTASTRVGIGTSSPYATLTVAGSLGLTGAFYDSTASAGTNGMILQTNGSGTTWVATSTLGIGGGATTFLALTDTPSSYTANRIPFTNSGATALTDSANLTFDGSLLSITGGLRATASSTIGDGTGAGGLTVFGNATTTGSLVVQGAATSTFTNGIALSGGCFRTQDGICLKTAGDTAVVVAAADSTAVEKTYADYVADGTNDEVEIQAALDALPSTGGTVYLLGGTFTVGTTTYASTSILITKSSTALKGQGANTVMKLKSSFNNDLSLITASNTTAVLIQGFTINGNSAGQSAGYQTAIKFIATASSTVDLTIIKDVRGTGISADSSSPANNFTNNQILRYGAYPYRAIYAPGSYVNIINNFTDGGGSGGYTISVGTYGHISNNTVQNAAYGPFASDYSVITNNVIKSMTSYGIGYGYNTYLAITSNTIDSCAIGINGASGPLYYSTIANNTIYNSTTEGIVVRGPGNTITGNTIRTSGTYGVKLSNYTTIFSTDNTVTGNIIKSSGASGIYLIATSSRNVISSNNIVDSATYAIQLDGTVSDTVITGNYYSGTGATIADAGSSTMYDQYDRTTISTKTGQGYNLLTITGSTTATSTAITQLGTGDILTLNNASSRVLTVLNNGYVGIGTSSPYATLTVAGSLGLTGALYDSTASAGTNGMILQTNGSGTTWVATSTLGLGGGGATTYLALTDTPSSYTANRIPFTNSGATALTDSANFVFDGTNLGIGTTTPTSKLSVTGTAGTGNLFVFASSTGSNLLTLNAAGVLTLTGTSNNHIMLSGMATDYANIGRATSTGGLALQGGDAWDTGAAIYLNGNSFSGQSQGSLEFAVGSSTSEYRWYKYDQSDQLMTLTGAGNLGIGTTTPSATLTVVGTPTSPYSLFVDTMGLGVTGGTIQLGNNTIGGDTLKVGSNLRMSSSNSLARYQSEAGVPLTLEIGTSEKMRITTDGRVGIGSSTPESLLLTLQKTGIATPDIAGIKEYLQFTNGSVGTVSYGDNAYIVNAPTATSTLVAKIIRVQDDTTLGNTVRGLEIQAQKGTNTKGENTGIAAFGRTFGVRGTTEGDAGGTYVPAGVIGESRGTTQGNALRAYSGTITSSTLVQLFHDTSAFTGTGLLMNFGNSGGSFSGSGAKFLDLQNGGTSKFTVTAQGTTTIGDGTTANMAGLQIGYGGLCVDNDGSCTASTTGRITSVSLGSGNSDLAEMYFSSDVLETGEIVALKGGLSIERADASNKEFVIGVVSTKPGLLLGFDDVSLTAQEQGYPVGLKGRVPVRLSTENGPIHKGDHITLSSIPGVGMKATGNDTVVGIALEDYTGDYAYTAGYLNQFGDDLVKAKTKPLNQNTDTRTQDGCSYGAGNEQGSAPCVKEKVTAIKTPTVSVDDRTAILATLERESAVTATTPAGATVTVGQALMFIELDAHFTDAARNVLTELTATSSVQNGDGTETIWTRIKTLAQNFVDGVLTIAGLRTNELCVGNVCVDEATFLRMVETAGGTTGTANTSVQTTPVPVPAPVETTTSPDASATTTATTDTTPTAPLDTTQADPVPTTDTATTSTDPVPTVDPAPETVALPTDTAPTDSTVTGI